MLELALAVLFAQHGPLESLIAAERAFARTSIEKTTQQAFLGVLAEDAIMFRDGPKPALQLLSDRPYPPDSWLKWAPMLADIAESGELGYTTGPWESGKRGETPRGKGYFVSVWRKERTGTWKLLVDLGIGTPAAMPVDNAASVLRAAPRVKAGNPGRGTASELLETDQRFAQLAASSGTQAAFEQLLADSGRVYRNGQEPAVGRVAAHPLLDAGSLKWRPDQYLVAHSGDLGYTIGSYEGEKERGSYVRIWRKSRDGWKIVLDITSPTSA